jgi:hypothetical protein
VPIGYPEGAIDEHSTYFHLIVCYPEQHALKEYLKEGRVQEVLKFWQDYHYRWVYKQVKCHLDLPTNIITKSGLNLAQ